MDDVNSQTEPALAKSSSPRRIVLLIHGIRTRAEWMELVKNILQQDEFTEVIPLRYDFFDAFRFWCPIGTRGKPIEAILWRMEDAIANNKGAELIIIAHSFGTYAITDILRRKPSIRPTRMIFCGSVVSADYRWDLLPNRPRVINECGSRDIWPILARAASWGYGASGTFGFGSPGVKDRFHDLPHGGYFTSEFIGHFWKSWVIDDVYEPSPFEITRPPAPYWRSVLAILPLRWIILILFMLLVSLPPYVAYSYSSAGIACSPEAVPLEALSETAIPVSDRPGKEQLSQQPAHSGGEVTFKFNNKTNQDLCLVLYNFDLASEKQKAADALGRTPWSIFRMPVQSNSEYFDQFAPGSGWFAFFVYNPKTSGAAVGFCYLGCKNLFNSKTPVLTVEHAVNPTRPFAGFFSEE